MISRAFGILFSAIMLTGCASAQTVDHSLRPLTRSSPIEQNILSQYQRVADMNASIGDERISFVDGHSSHLDRYRIVIEPRLNSDLLNTYNQLPGKADTTYLLVGNRLADSMAFVIRIKKHDETGAYEPLEGLVYRFDRRDGRILSVQSDKY